ncbi:gamma-aminobutyric acid receptor subunit alpha-2-like [Saccostrea echinata]|uniref:gamma-aminobutyric acid receptor subunit alpha-2-like n=1 Tax=Saccostrea echinata TaxID=191078 RepID=UPI002A8142B2|nr:gamma-aminobutyric acid receptor subunit alpha-2-like [Saccostrea echinata]
MKKRTVYVRVVFLKVGEIDTVKEKYCADVFVQARWREPSLDFCQHLRNTKLDNYWDPRMSVQNVIDSKKKKVLKELTFGPNEEAYIVEKRKLSGNFSEKLELGDFPFDHQYLNLIITSEIPASELEFVEDTEELSTINVSCFVDVQEWSLYDYVDFVPYTETKVFSQKRNVNAKFPGISVGCCAVRRAGFFVWNVIVIMTLICATSFATFAVSRKLPQNRLQLSITLMLTAVTFRLTTNANLPKISYHTRLDKFILTNMFFNWLVTAWHALITRFEYDEVLQETMDNWAFVVFLISYGVFLLVFGILVLITYVIRNNELETKLHKYEEKAEKLMGGDWKDSREKEHEKVTVKRRAGLSYTTPGTAASVSPMHA